MFDILSALRTAQLTSSLELITLYLSTYTYYVPLFLLDGTVMLAFFPITYYGQINYPMSLNAYVRREDS